MSFIGTVTDYTRIVYGRGQRSLTLWILIKSY